VGQSTNPGRLPVLAAKTQPQLSRHPAKPFACTRYLHLWKAFRCPLVLRRVPGEGECPKESLETETQVRWVAVYVSRNGAGNAACKPLGSLFHIAMDFIWGFFDRLAGHDVDRRKVISALVLLILIAAGFLAYERITLSFTLDRLQKSADLVLKLQEISNELRTNPNQELEADYQAIKAQSEKAIRLVPAPYQIATLPTQARLMDIFTRFLCGSGFLWVFWFAALSFHFKKPQPEPSAKIGFWNITKTFAQVGFVYGFWGVLMPKVYWPFDWWPLVHILVWPALLTIILSSIAALFIEPRSHIPSQGEAK
jgi:hypothetical protein